MTEEEFLFHDSICDEIVGQKIRGTGRLDAEIWGLVFVSPSYQAAADYVVKLAETEMYAVFRDAISHWIVLDSEEEKCVHAYGMLQFIKNTTYDRFAATYSKYGEDLESADKD
jgi:hypothetical protein